MEPDYPAAHSMDTTWFAVDRDGHVACFESGEAGAVPVEAWAGDEAWEARRQIALLLPRREAIHDLAGRTLPGLHGADDPHWGSTSRYPVLMFLASLDPVRDEVAAGRAVPLPAADGVAVLLRGLSEDELRRLHEAGACCACFMYFVEEEDDDRIPDLARHGIFVYEHLTDNWIAGPYGRERRPAQPAHVDQLPPRLREQVKRLRLGGVSFAETPHLQPVDHAPCDSWEAAYLDVAGKHIRPIPGKETEYAEHYRERHGDQGPFHIEPPRR